MNKDAFKSLPFRKRIQYILRKYGWEAVFTVYLVGLLGSWVYVEYFVPQPVLSVEMIDGNQKSPDSAAFAAFLEEEGYVCDAENVKVSKILQLGNGPDEICCNPSALLTCKAHIGKTDVYFWDDRLVEDTLIKQDLADLRMILPPEVLDACKDRLVYTEPLLRGGYPCAIRLTDNQWIAENQFYEQCSVGVSWNVKDRELVSAFLQYII